MQITKLKLNSNCLGKTMLLVDVTPYYAYSEGQRTNQIEGHRYTVVLPELGFEKLGIKVEGEKLIDKPEDAVPVAFEGLVLSIYGRAGNFDVAAKASNIKLLKTA